MAPNQPVLSSQANRSKGDLLKRIVGIWIRPEFTFWQQLVRNILIGGPLFVGVQFGIRRLMDIPDLPWWDWKWDVLIYWAEGTFITTILTLPFSFPGWVKESEALFADPPLAGTSGVGDRRDPEEEAELERAAAAFERLTESQWDQLSAIEPSDDHGFRYYPCHVTLGDGSTRNRVCLVSARDFIVQWFAWDKPPVPTEQVVQIEESPFRLPARFANQLYAYSESRRDYCVFQVHFKDGTSKAYMSSGIFDFIVYPIGLGPSDVIGVTPNRGRRDDLVRTPDFEMCPFRPTETPSLERSENPHREQNQPPPA